MSQLWLTSSSKGTHTKGIYVSNPHLPPYSSPTAFSCILSFPEEHLQAAKHRTESWNIQCQQTFNSSNEPGDIWQIFKKQVKIYMSLPVDTTFPDNRAIAYSVSPLGRGEAWHSLYLQGQLPKTRRREAKLWPLGECRKLRCFSFPKAEWLFVSIYLYTASVYL